MSDWDKAQEWLIDEEDKHLLNTYSWRVNSNGYICRNPKMKNWKYEKIERYLHRLVIGAGKGDIVDHINRNKLDNRKCNLRLVSYSQNILNKNSIGVVKVNNKYRAYIGENHKQKHLGYFNRFEDALMARKVAYDSRF